MLLMAMMQNFSTEINRPQCAATRIKPAVGGGYSANFTFNFTDSVDCQRTARSIDSQFRKANRQVRINQLLYCDNITAMIHPTLSN